MLMYPQCFGWHIFQIMNAFYTILTFHFKFKTLYLCNSPTWTDENQLKCEKVHFLSEMSEIDSRWVILNL